VTSLSTELSKVDVELAEINAFMDAEGFSPTLGKRAKALDDRKQVLLLRIGQESLHAAHPLSEAWGEAQGLLSVVKTDDDCLRLRTVLRRIVSAIWLLVVPRGRDRLAFAQVWFEDGKAH